MFDTGCFVHKNQRDSFGEHWIGGEKLTLHQWSLVARYEKQDEDGMPVDVYCMPMPARFYRLDAQECTDSAGEHREGFTLSTGTIPAKLVAAIADAIASGMLGLE